MGDRDPDWLFLVAPPKYHDSRTRVAGTPLINRKHGMFVAYLGLLVWFPYRSLSFLGMDGRAPKYRTKGWVFALLMPENPHLEVAQMLQRINVRARGLSTHFWAVLPFLVFGECLVFLSLCEKFLGFSSVFPSFPKDFRGSTAMKNPLFFGRVFLPFSPKGSYHCKPPVAITAPNFSKLVSKFWKLVSERKYALTSRKYALTSRKYRLTSRKYALAS